MIDFQYYNPAKIVFGKGALDRLGALLNDEKAESVLMVYSGDFVEKAGIYKKVENVCAENGIAFCADGNVRPNPSIELVRELVKTGRERKVDFVLAVGGGSSIDTAKAVALGIPYEGDVWDFFSKGAEVHKVLPVGVVATIPASGSETSNCAILSNGEWKLGFEDDSIIPKFAIMNPEYTLTLPAFQTAAGIADILSHLLERYFSDVKHTDVTDYMIEGALKALLVNAERIVKDPGDIDARSEIQWLASIAHNNLLDTGRTADWGSHRIEHELSAQYGITHGEGMAVVLIAWIKYAAKVKPFKTAQLAVRVFGGDKFNSDDEELTLMLAEKLTEFFKKLGLKTSLAELEIDSEYFYQMANRATKNGSQTVGHYIPLDIEKFVEILKLAL